MRVGEARRRAEADRGSAEAEAEAVEREVAALRAAIAPRLR